MCVPAKIGKETCITLFASFSESGGIPGCAGMSFARSAGRVRAARRIRRAVRRSCPSAKDQRDRRPAAGLAGPKAVTASPPPEPDPSHNEVVGKLMAAMADGDLDAVVALLHPDVTFTGDSDGKAPTAVQVIHGADKVVRFMLGLAQRYGPSMYTAYELGFINGELGIYTAGLPAADGYREMLPRIMAMTVRDGKVCALWDIANPDKFTGSPLSRRS